MAGKVGLPLRLSDPWGSRRWSWAGSEYVRPDVECLGGSEMAMYGFPPIRYRLSRYLKPGQTILLASFSEFSKNIEIYYLSSRREVRSDPNVTYQGLVSPLHRCSIPENQSTGECDPWGR